MVNRPFIEWRHHSQSVCSKRKGREWPPSYCLHEIRDEETRPRDDDIKHALKWKLGQKRSWPPLVCQNERWIEEQDDNLFRSDFRAKPQVTNDRAPDFVSRCIPWHSIPAIGEFSNIPKPNLPNKPKVESHASYLQYWIYNAAMSALTGSSAEIRFGRNGSILWKYYRGGHGRSVCSKRRGREWPPNIVCTRLFSSARAATAGIIFPDERLRPDTTT